MMAAVPRPRGPGLFRAFLHRRYQGFGDWLFALAVAKMVNRQHPNVRIHAVHRATTGLQAQAWRHSDVRWTPSKPQQPYTEVFELIYRKWPPNDYIESSVANWNDLTPWPLEYEPGLFPAFCGGKRWHGRGDYGVMVGHGKMTERGGREWGYPNWNTICTDLTKRVGPMVQIGHSVARPLRHARTRHLGRSFPEVVDILCGARFYLGPENGIMVLAGYLGVPQITIYDGHQVEEPHNRCGRSSFDNHLKVAQRIEPPEALEEIAAWLHQS